MFVSDGEQRTGGKFALPDRWNLAILASHPLPRLGSSMRTNVCRVLFRSRFVRDSSRLVSPYHVSSCPVVSLRECSRPIACDRISSRSVAIENQTTSSKERVRDMHVFELPLLYFLHATRERKSTWNHCFDFRSTSLYFSFFSFFSLFINKISWKLFTVRE